MRQHGPLGRPGGARGVDQQRGALGVDGGQPFVEGANVVGAMALAARQEVRPRDDHGVGERAQPLHVHDHDLFEVRQALAHLQGLVELLLVLDEVDSAFRVAEDVLAFDRRVGGVDADGDAADRLGGEIGVQPFRAVLADDRHAFAGLDPQREQPVADRAHVLGILPPGDVMPDSQPLFAQRGRLRPGLGMVEEVVGRGRRVLGRRRNFHDATPWLAITIHYCSNSRSAIALRQG